MASFSLALSDPPLPYTIVLYDFPGQSMWIGYGFLLQDRSPPLRVDPPFIFFPLLFPHARFSAAATFFFSSPFPIYFYFSRLEVKNPLTGPYHDNPLFPFHYPPSTPPRALFKGQLGFSLFFYR